MRKLTFVRLLARLNVYPPKNDAEVDALSQNSKCIDLQKHAQNIISIEKKKRKKEKNPLHVLYLLTKRSQP